MKAHRLSTVAVAVVIAVSGPQIVSAAEAPVASSATVVTTMDTPVTVTLTASDADGDPLQYVIVDEPTNGELGGTPPDLLYTPRVGFTGLDSLTFMAEDGTQPSEVATVYLTVTATSGGAPAISNPVPGGMIDGNIAEWQGLRSFGPDPDDVTGSVNKIDWLECWMAHSTASVFFAYSNDGPIDPSWGLQVYMDTDGDPMTGYLIGSLGADYVIERDIVSQYTGDGDTWEWMVLGNATLAVADATAEVEVPRDWLGPVTDLQLLFYGDNLAYPGGVAVDAYPDGAAGTEGIEYFQYTLAP